MVEVKKPDPELGIFDYNQLNDPKVRDSVLECITNKRFVILMIDEKMKGYKAIHEISKCCSDYCGLAFIVNGVGTQAFNDTFHRSNTYVHSNAISPKVLSEIIKGNPDFLSFLAEIKQRFTEFQIKGMNKIIPRMKNKVKVEAQVEETVAKVEV